MYVPLGFLHTQNHTYMYVQSGFLHRYVHIFTYTYMFYQVFFTDILIYSHIHYGSSGVLHGYINIFTYTICSIRFYSQIYSYKHVCSIRFSSQIYSFTHIYMYISSGFIHQYIQIFTYTCTSMFHQVFYTDRSIVVSAPTGSGKTVIFELALIRLLTKRDTTDHKAKVVYSKPVHWMSCCCLYTHVYNTMLNVIQ